MSVQYKYIFLFICFLLSSGYTIGQIQAPDLVCVKGDTLRFEGPNETCGPFLGYKVYGSTNVNGPYSLLATITDPNATEYVNPNTANTTWYYYLQSDYNCPGLTPLSSDTLDNQPPAKAVISYVTIENGTVRIFWLPSTSKKTFAYVILRVTQSGTIPIDTVYSGLSYVDLGAKPADQSEYYYVLSMDECGWTSQYDITHQTVHLSYDPVLPCDGEISLKWNLYSGWGSQVSKFEIFENINNTGWKSVVKTKNPQNIADIKFNDQNPFKQHCYYISYFNADSSLESKSNVVCFNTTGINKNLAVVPTNISFDPSNQLILNWQIDINTFVKEYKITGAGLDQVFSPNAKINTSDFTKNLGQNVPFGANYNLTVVDSCSNSFQSGDIKPIVLVAGDLNTSTRKWEWSPLYLPNIEITSYKLNKTVSGITSVVESGDASVLSYNETYNPVLKDSVCYFVTATSTITLPDGQLRDIISNSNTVCPHPQTRIFVPNAFTPVGNNPDFRPVIANNEQLESYQMMIFDRWGNKVFETKDYQTGWNGRKGDVETPIGVYVYLIKATDKSGKSDEKKGSFVLIR